MKNCLRKSAQPLKNPLPLFEVHHTSKARRANVTTLRFRHTCVRSVALGSLERPGAFRRNLRHFHGRRITREGQAAARIRDSLRDFPMFPCVWEAERRERTRHENVSRKKFDKQRWTTNSESRKTTRTAWRLAIECWGNVESGLLGGTVVNRERGLADDNPPRGLDSGAGQRERQLPLRAARPRVHPREGARGSWLVLEARGSHSVSQSLGRPAVRYEVGSVNERHASFYLRPCCCGPYLSPKETSSQAAARDSTSWR